jgi:hypothetical protein
METCWLPSLDNAGVDAMIRTVTGAFSGCAIFTHECKGVATRVPLETTAFGLRRDRALIEIVAACADGSNRSEEQHHHWALTTRHAFDAIALPGGYSNLLANDDVDRWARSYGPNAEPFVNTKRHYDTDNVFRSTIPLRGAKNDRRFLDYRRRSPRSGERLRRVTHHEGPHCARQDRH